MNNDAGSGLAAQDGFKPQVVSGRVCGGLVPRNMDELQRLAKLMAASASCQGYEGPGIHRRGGHVRDGNWAEPDGAYRTSP